MGSVLFFCFTEEAGNALAVGLGNILKMTVIFSNKSGARLII
jgi:hypothetical protein